MKLVYPEELPVSKRREAIRDSLESNQVVIVCGDTGSGKTTQLPKIVAEVLEAEALRKKQRRRPGLIGCTQPRRIAATSVAKRVANECGVEMGQEVGYQIRFEDRTSRETTRIKFMTDGVLLAETRSDPRLKRYDAIIVDEAHERSLNIDFILGYLKRTLAQRRGLRVIVSSATLDAEAFSTFFRDAPVIEVEGRMFPVEDRYQEPTHQRESVAEQVLRAAEDLAADDPLGDTLVFLPGEREIRECTELLEGRRLSSTMILPLYARQSGGDQKAVFEPVSGKRRIVLATNVAETSLTIPGIRFVIDSGIARISRHDVKSGVQRLQVEPISQASARQRRGRCGRISEGVCVRLYSEEEFEERPAFTDPEILRSNLSGVVLQMEHLGLGDPLKFPFINPPSPKRVDQAYRVLDEIGALELSSKKVRLTNIGEDLARLPLDPRVGRILIEAEEENCLREALIVASALTVQDPRERPREAQEAAAEAHRRFQDRRSDFTGWLRLWHGIEEARAHSNNALRRFCQKNFLNFRRVMEWRNLHRELRDILRQLKWKVPSTKEPLPDPADSYSEALHRAMLSAIPSQIGLKVPGKPGYRGGKGRQFWLFPGSGLFGGAPQWVMSFELVETAKLYARNNAQFDPAWMEKIAPHLCRYRYSNPHWKKDQGAVYGEETVTAFGLPVVEQRRIHYGRVDAAVARRIFIQEALVNGETRSPLSCLDHNRKTARAAERLEHKLRRAGGLIHPEAIEAFYLEIIPREIHTQKAFEKWIGSQPDGALNYAIEDIIIPTSEPIDHDALPDVIVAPDGETWLPLTYLHDSRDPADGITVEIPLGEVLELPDWFGDWLVPGWWEEKVSQLLRCLRKDFRTLLPSNREVVDGFIKAWTGYDATCSMLEALIDHLGAVHEVEVREEHFEVERLAD
ncbi:MAG: ATP-dependent RNA helicase HrpA, partial [Verrucomicrobiota bacterium]